MKQESESKRKLLEAAIDMISQSSYGSVSVDDICEKAGVNKGSFYYAFKSKSDLAVAAYERHWEHKREKMDRIFSPQLSPLERLDQWMNVIIEDQRTHYQASGKMIGCPFCSIGSELGSQDENIRRKSEEIGVKVVKYIESLVRDMAAEGLIEVRDTHELAEEVGAYVVGVLLQAKIENSMKQVEKLRHGVVRLLGLREPQRAAA